MKLKQKKMTTHQTPEDKNQYPEPIAPKLPESLAMDPKIQTERDNIQGKVLYSSKPEEEGKFANPLEAYKEINDQQFAEIAEGKPGWFQRALTNRELLKARKKTVTDDILNKNEAANRHFSLLHDKQIKDALKQETELEALKKEKIKAAVKTAHAKTTGKVQNFFAALGGAPAAFAAGAINTWQNVRDERKKTNLHN